jgi:hypothetical protein
MVDSPIKKTILAVPRYPQILAGDKDLSKSH